MTIHDDVIAAYDQYSHVLLAPAAFFFRGVEQYTADFDMLDSVEWDSEAWTFNMTAVFHHRPSGTLFYANDSGCSCPSPFEATSVTDLKPLARLQDWIDLVDSSTRELKLDEEDVRLGRLEDANYRPWDSLSDMQRQLSYVTDQTHRVYNRISNHFETHDIVEDFKVSVVEEKDDE